MPFSTADFFAVFAEYNTAVWPVQLVLLAGAGFVVATLGRQWARRPVLALLAILWAWMGLVYHWRFFSPINPAARGFALLFVAAAAAFAWFARFPGRLEAPAVGARRLVGWILIGYALVGYPLLAYLAGHHYPAAPTFGLPCPTTIFTLGTLLVLSAATPLLLFAIPILWSAIGALAAVHLDVVEDYALSAAGMVTVALLWGERHRRPRHGRESPGLALPQTLSNPYAAGRGGPARRR